MLEQMSSGKKIAKPSDDPVIAQKGMYYRSNLNEVTQYKRNLSEVYLWMDNAEAGMEQANSNLQRIEPRSLSYRQQMIRTLMWTVRRLQRKSTS